MRDFTPINLPWYGSVLLVNCELEGGDVLTVSLYCIIEELLKEDVLTIILCHLQAMTLTLFGAFALGGAVYTSIGNIRISINLSCSNLHYDSGGS